MRQHGRCETTQLVKGVYGHAKGAAHKDNGVVWGKVELTSPELEAGHAMDVVASLTPSTRSA